MSQADDFRALFRHEFSWVWNTLRRLGVQPVDLKDQCQEVFLRVHRLRSEYDASRPLRPWLFAIAYRVVGRYRSGRARHPVMEAVDLADDAAGPDENLMQKEARALVLAALQAIELNRRAVFILADIEERAVPEIAQTLGIPLNTAYSRLRVAREEFAQAVARIRLRGGRS